MRLWILAYIQGQQDLGRRYIISSDTWHGPRLAGGTLSRSGMWWRTWTRTRTTRYPNGRMTSIVSVVCGYVMYAAHALESRLCVFELPAMRACSVIIKGSNILLTGTCVIPENGTGERTREDVPSVLRSCCRTTSFSPSCRAVPLLPFSPSSPHTSLQLRRHHGFPRSRHS